MAYSDKTIQTLNLLTETCINGAHGYNFAASMIKAHTYKLLLHTVAQQRETYTALLQSMVLQAGHIPVRRETPLLAAAHRRWIKVRARINSEEPIAVLTECERGDAIALLNYEKALAAPLPIHVKSSITTQFHAVRAVHDRISALREALQMNAKSRPLLIHPR